MPDAGTQPQKAVLSAGPAHVPLDHTCRPLSHSRTFRQVLATQHGPHWAKVKTPSPSCWLELSRVSNKLNTHVPKLMKPDMALHSPMQRILGQPHPSHSSGRVWKAHDTAAMDFKNQEAGMLAPASLHPPLPPLSSPLLSSPSVLCGVPRAFQDFSCLGALGLLLPLTGLTLKMFSCRAPSHPSGLIINVPIPQMLLLTTLPLSFSIMVNGIQ